MCVISCIFDYTPSIWELKVFEVKVGLISFELYYFLSVFIDKCTFLAHAFYFLEEYFIEFSVAFNFFLFESDFYIVGLGSASIDDFNG